ncbi:MAG: DUF1992 domain-containing protein [Pyrinomonas sp.]|uniref:DnaJ family domain-containing protein n=1 Tax=Pyrinomonas sp. TaxID=2080306 RepID=UPI00332D7249
MGLEKIIEERIKEAIERGEFNDLVGKGKPLDLAPYFQTPEDLRLGYSVLRSAGFLPEEARLLKEVEGLREQLARAEDQSARTELERQIADRQARYAMLMERRRRRGRKLE